MEAADREEEKKAEEEMQANKAMQTLGALLRQLKQEKERRARIEALKEAGIDPNQHNLEKHKDIYFEDDVIAAQLANRRNVNNKKKRFMVYPEDRFRAYWDYLMTW